MAIFHSEGGLDFLLPKTVPFNFPPHPGTTQAVTLEKWQGDEAPRFLYEEDAMINTAKQVADCQARDTRLAAQLRPR